MVPAHFPTSTPTSTSTSARPGSAPAQRGLTLIETCVVLAVTAIIAGAAVPGLRDTLDARRLNGAATELAADLHLARVSAIARNEGLRVTFGTAADGAACYVVHTGAAGACPCPVTATAAVCSGGALALRTVRLPAAGRVTLDSSAASVLFDPVHGTSTPTGTVRLLGTRERAVHHIVNVMGRVRSCTPQGLVPGYRAC